MFVKLSGRLCLVVGAGPVGEAKIEGLLASGATVRVVAPRATPAVEEWARWGRIVWDARAFQPADLEGTFLVVAATSSVEVNDSVFSKAQRRGVLCNVVDDPERCDFYSPAVVRRGDLQIAISTNGRSPALAARLRRELEEQFGPEYEAWIEQLGQKRKELLSHEMDPDERRRLLHQQAGREAFERFIRELGLTGFRRGAA
jgi:precorrin-2 dehydrogenase/sirohydrochlorin ferrochelatase